MTERSDAQPRRDDPAFGTAPAALRADDQPLAIASEQLLRGRRWVEILHNGEVYRLQATRLGKLILTK